MPGRARPLFVAGCQRSGTTAFADYANRHPRMLVGVERYGRIPAKTITPELFTFERILDYREETIRPREYYAELLSEKRQEELDWIGDKNPNYVLHLGVLARNNPEARFIVLYRPAEEVAESWGVQSRSASDPWRGRENGFERGVHAWNRALSNTRRFVENGFGARVLVVSYHDFFYRNEACVPLISRFLDLEFDDEVLGAWRRMSTSFEAERRRKSPLNEEQARFVEEHKDLAAEEWVLGRIEEQWKSLERDRVEAEGMVRAYGGEPYKLAATAVRARRVAEDEAGRTRGLGLRAQELEGSLEESKRAAERLERRNAKLALQVRDLEDRLRDVQGSRTWKVLDGLKRLRTSILSGGRRSG